MAAQTRAAGWTGVKWVVPPKGGTEAERLRRLSAEMEAVRRGGGPDLDIALEMWETLTVRTAPDLARAVAPFRPLFLEEPFWREVPRALGEIAARSPVPVAAGEALVSRYEFRQLLEARGAQILPPDVIHCDGTTETRRIAALGETYGAEIAPRMFYGPAAHVASLQAVASTRNFLMQEWDAALDAVFESITGGTYPKVRHGHATLSERPGLGLEMDWAALDKRYPYRGQSLRPPGGH